MVAMIDAETNTSYEHVVLDANVSNDQQLLIYTESPACQLYTFILYPIIMGTMIILGLVGNVISFLVFWKDKLKTSTSFLFQGLSLVDVVMLVIAIPVYIIPPFVQYTQWFTIYGLIEAYVLVYVFPLASIAQTATIWLTVLVCVNRYIAVCKPYQASRLCTVTQARKQFALVLVCAVIYNVPKFAEGCILYAEDGSPMPQYTALGANKYYHIIYQTICYIAFMLVVPLSTLTILNIRLISSLKEIRKRRAEMNMRQQQDNNVTFVLIIVVLVFTICQAPALATQIFWTVLPDSARACGGFQYYWSRISNAMVILNSSINFLIYFLFNQRFRQVLLENMCRCKVVDRGPAYSNMNQAKNNAPQNTTITQVNHHATNNHNTITVKDAIVANCEGTNETLL